MTMLTRMLVVVLLTAGLMAQQPPDPPPPDDSYHAPEHCARRAGFTEDGTEIRACACKHMGVMDGEGCVPAEETRDCKAFCRRDWCACPAICDLPPGSPAHVHLGQ